MQRYHIYKFTLLTVLHILLFIVATNASLHGQKVTVSKDMSVRSDVSYNLLGQLDDRILLYRDKGNEKLMEVFDENLKFLYDRQLRLTEPKSKVYDVIPSDEDFTVFYGYRKKKEFSLVAQRYTKDVQSKDTTFIIENDKDIKVRSFDITMSEDKSKVLLLGKVDDEIIKLYMLESDSFQILWQKEVLINDYSVHTDLYDVFITNEGEANLFFYDSQKEGDKAEPQFLLLGLGFTEDLFANKFLLNKKYIIDIEVRYDTDSRRFVMAGLSSDDAENDADSYFVFSQDLDKLEELNAVATRNFDAGFIQELYGEKLGRKKRLKDFVTRDVILRNDGGLVLITEMEREFYRRSSFNSASRNGDNFGRGWVDIYTEDIVIINVAPDGKEGWKKILYKKQFSQDDGGIYSSFFIFKNPSRLRMIYNDEIKNNITVSEYVSDPLGRVERNSLLSTEYQKLKIRWRDALQISATQMIAPSENNYKLSLVKIDYGIKS